MRRKKIYKALAFCLSTVMLAQPVFATTVQQTAQGSLGSVTEESQILPIPGESGKYILKSNGFYCLNEDGTKVKFLSILFISYQTFFDTMYNIFVFPLEILLNLIVLFLDKSWIFSKKIRRRTVCYTYCGGFK